MKHHTIQKNHKTLIIAVFAVGVLLYVGFNWWVFTYAQKLQTKGASKSSSVSGTNSNSNTGDSNANPIQTFIQYINKPTNLSTRNQANPTPIYIDTGKSLSPGFTPAPTAAPPTPTPTPIQGPGKYACDPDGVCGAYSDTMRAQYCTASYADRNCLGQCIDSSKRCRR